MKVKIKIQNQYINVYNISVSVLLVSSASSSSFCCQPPPCPRHLQCPHLSELLTGSSPYDSLASSFLGSYHLSKQRDSLKEIRQNSNSGSKNRENQNNDAFHKKKMAQKSPFMSMLQTYYNSGQKWTFGIISLPIAKALECSCHMKRIEVNCNGHSKRVCIKLGITDTFCQTIFKLP